jgi:hypothetical protein
MQTHSTPRSAQKSEPSAGKPFAARADASIRDSVRVLAEIVAQLSERIELLEAREALVRAR